MTRSSANSTRAGFGSPARLQTDWGTDHAMTSNAEPGRSAADIRDYLLQQLNSALRRPGMFGAEMALRLYCDAIAFTDRSEQLLAEDLRALKSREAFASTGVTGAVERVLGHRAEDVMASVYAEIAHQHAWLTLDSNLPEANYGRILDLLPAWCAKDHSHSETIAEFGEPSMLIGGSNPLYPKTLAYATAQADSPLIFFHLWNGTQPGKTSSWPPEHPEPILLAARHGGARFIDGFIFTPTGSVRCNRLTS
jgi:hypothetical protein